MEAVKTFNSEVRTAAPAFPPGPALGLACPSQGRGAAVVPPPPPLARTPGWGDGGRVAVEGEGNGPRPSPGPGRAGGRAWGRARGRVGGRAGGPAGSRGRSGRRRPRQAPPARPGGFHRSLVRPAARLPTPRPLQGSELLQDITPQVLPGDWRRLTHGCEALERTHGVVIRSHVTRSVYY